MVSGNHLQKKSYFFYLSKKQIRITGQQLLKETKKQQISGGHAITSHKERRHKVEAHLITAWHGMSQWKRVICVVTWNYLDILCCMYSIYKNQSKILTGCEWLLTRTGAGRREEVRLMSQSSYSWWMESRYSWWTEGQVHVHTHTNRGLRSHLKWHTGDQFTKCFSSQFSKNPLICFEVVLVCLFCEMKPCVWDFVLTSGMTFSSSLHLCFNLSWQVWGEVCR